MKPVGRDKEDLIIEQGMNPMSDQEHIEICKGPVLSEPAKVEIVADVERVITECEIPEVLEPVITECEIPEEPEPEETAPRRANFSGSGLDGLGGGNIL
jgi:hypothetical protein